MHSFYLRFQAHQFLTFSALKRCLTLSISLHRDRDYLLARIREAAELGGFFYLRFTTAVPLKVQISAAILLRLWKIL